MRYLLGLLALIHLSALRASETPEAAAEAFYRWVIVAEPGGLPSAAQRKELARLLTPDFVKLLAATSEAERRCVAGLPPDMKGDIWEGNLFVSNYEGATEVWYGESRTEGRDVIIEANLLGADDKRPKGDRNRIYVWRDSVRLSKTKEGWLVADVLVGESFNDSQRTPLTKTLRDYVKHGCGRISGFLTSPNLLLHTAQQCPLGSADLSKGHHHARASSTAWLDRAPQHRTSLGR
jgi:hypothetical protein